MKFRIVARSVTLICLGEYSGQTASSAKKKLPSSPCSYWMNGERLQIVHGDLLLAGQRIVARDDTCNGAREQRMELEMLLAQQLANHVLVEVGQVDDADLRKHVRHLVDDVLRAGLADGELVFVGLGGVDHLHERLHGEHVMLRGHGAQLFAGVSRSCTVPPSSDA